MKLALGSALRQIAVLSAMRLVGNHDHVVALGVRIGRIDFLIEFLKRGSQLTPPTTIYCDFGNKHHMPDGRYIQGFKHFKSIT